MVNRKRCIGDKGIDKEQRHGIGPSNIVAADVCKRGRVSGHPSALNSTMTELLVQRDHHEMISDWSQYRDHWMLGHKLKVAM